MDKKYWDTVAKNYEDEIFDVLNNDKGKVIEKSIKKLASKDKVVNDFGCGVGKFLQILSDEFKHVNAIDISDECLRTSRTAYGDIGNIDFLKRDLTKVNVEVPKSGFGICVNAVMMPGHERRINFFNNISSSINKNGYFLLVVPSLESFHYVNVRFHEWNFVEGVMIKESVTGIVETLSGKVEDVLSGMISIDGILTKHYLKEELDILFRKIGFKIEALKKIEYTWETEFVDPPKWLNDPYPWDWFVLARKE